MELVSAIELEEEFEGTVPMYRDDDFRVWTVDDYDDAHEALTPIIDGIIFENTINMMFAPTGHGKSFSAVALACAVASGQPFGGHSTHQGEVIYVCTEATGAIVKRIKAWASHYGLSTPTILIPEFDGQFNTFNPTHMDRLRRFVETRNGAVSLIVIDNMSQATFGVVENEPAMVNERVIGPLMNLRDKANAAILMVHHTGKGDTRSPRGASAYVDACDTVIRIDTTFETAERRDTILVTELEAYKCRHTENFKSIYLAPRKQGSTLVFVPAGEQEVDLKPKAGKRAKSPRKDGTERQRGGSSQRPSSREQIMMSIKEGITQPQLIADHTGIALKTVKNNLTAMKNDQLIVNISGEWSVAA